MGVDTVSHAEFFARHLPGTPPSENRSLGRDVPGRGQCQGSVGGEGGSGAGVGQGWGPVGDGGWSGMAVGPGWSLSISHFPAPDN